jgi:septal ring factor EnvC (AmiA/AmiB activator)
MDALLLLIFKNKFKMKHIPMFLFAAVLMVSFAACQGGKKAEEAVETPAVEAVEVAVVEEVPAAPALSPAETLKAFQAFAKEYGEAFNNLTKDPQKFQKLASEITQKVTEMELVKAELTPAQLKAYEKALKIITDVNSGGTKK